MNKVHLGKGNHSLEVPVYMRIDKINVAIIKELIEGRRPFKIIAEHLSLSENTVRARVKSLIADGVLDISGHVNPETLPRHRVVMVGVKLQTMNFVKKGEEFSRLKGVVSVSVVTGRYDLILMVLLNDDFDLLEFFTDEVAGIDDVQSVETFVVYKGYNLKVPYIL
jgi:Lrp/AsnC family transcriptional regulator for asnA, asnC and gidA